MFGTLDKIFKSEMYIPMYLQITMCIAFWAPVDFFCFLFLDSAVGKEPCPDVLSAVANTLYHSPVSGD